jgi:glycosyltransferase involved in cell wall biosynthesis
MNRPFFSVVIPTHNRSDYLKEALQSVLSQSYADFELLVIDDHSRDNTKDIVGSFGDARIRYFLNDHKEGGAGARNAGIARARGEWVVFLDDDDVFMPRKLELIYKRIRESDNGTGLIYTGYDCYDFEASQNLFTFTPEKAGWVHRDLFKKNCIGPISTVAVRTEHLKNVGGLDERLPASQDYDLYLRVTRLCKVAFIGAPLTRFRRFSRDRITGDMGKKLAARELIWKKYAPQAGTPVAKHYMAARLFTAALLEKDLGRAIKALPWTLAGVVLDIPYFIKTLKEIFSGLFKKILKRDNRKKKNGHEP